MQLKNILEMGLWKRFRCEVVIDENFDVSVKKTHKTSKINFSS